MESLYLFVMTLDSGFNPITGENIPSEATYNEMFQRLLGSSRNCREITLLDGTDTKQAAQNQKVI